MSVITATKENPKLTIPKYFLGEWYSDDEQPQFIITEVFAKMFITDETTLDFKYEVQLINAVEHEVTLTSIISDALTTYNAEIILKAANLICGIPEAIQGSIALDGTRMLQFLFVHPFVRFAHLN